MNEETRENEQGAAPEPSQPSDSAQASSAPAPSEEAAAAPSAASEPSDSAEASSAPAPSEEAAAAPSAVSEPSDSAQASSAPAPSEEAAAAPSEGPELPGAEAGDASTDGAESTEAADASGEPTKKKRKRRRKKKKKAEGEQRQAFTSFFEGAPRAHAFRVGEIVAGRVERVERGVILVDLFGKATAIVDELEPREVPEPPSEAPGAEASAESAESEGAGAERAEVAVEAPADAEAPKTVGGEPIDVSAESDAAAEDAAEAATEAASTESAQAAAADAATEAAAADAAVTEAAVTEAAAADAATEAEGSSEPAGDPEASVEASQAQPVADAASTDVASAADAPQPEPPPPPPVGSIFRGRVGGVAESGHVVIVNRIVDRAAAKARIAALREAHQRVQGVVYGYNRGGFDVLVEGIRAFCPAGGMSLQPIEDPGAFVGQKLEFTLPPNRGGGKSIIVSRRGILEREARKKARARLKELKVGDRLEGAVTDIRDYGVLVDLGEGLEGLVHQSEVSWTRGQRPADAVEVGQVVQVEVLKVQPATRKDRQGRVSLSIRRCLPDPWEAHAEALTVGSIHQGKVVGTTEFGAFLEILPGVEGLLHISELGGRDLKHAKQAVAEGETIEVLIERIDRKERRISLSKVTAEDKKAIESGEFDPAAARSLRQGGYVTVVIHRVEHHGLLGTVKGVVGKRGRVYIPNRELVVEGAARKKAYAPGVEVEAKIIGKDREGQLRCSIKARHVDEERRAVKEYRKEASKQGFGTFGDLLKAKLGKE